ncbi:CopD family protein [Psychroflexus sp. MBR-150]|jgi:putative membrane protein
MTYLYIKALHIIFVVTWFAGLFYIPRLFIYYIEAQNKPKVERDILSSQLQSMAKRLWYMITWPSAVITLIFGVWLLVLNPSLLALGWMHIKLLFIIILWLYHLKNHQLYIQMKQNKLTWSSSKMRIWNEVATVVLFAVVFLAVLKTSIGWVFGIFGLIALGLLLMIGIKAYKNYRLKKGKD